MAGGLLNLIAIGNANVFLTGDPTKTFFRVAYCKHTNFGLQKFRIDYNGTRDLRLTEASTFLFKVPRYADLLMDTYLVFSLPDIWSPIFPPIQKRLDSNGNVQNEGKHTNNKWVPYEFRWIEDLGAQMIQEIEIRAGSFVLARYGGNYISAMASRDFCEKKKKAFDHMTGNVKELNNPALAYNRENAYPNVYYDESNPPVSGLEPSIRGRNLYIPLNAWFTMDSRCAFPLVSLQYSELEISVTIRPIQDLFQVRDVQDVNDVYEYPYIRPDFNQDRFQMFRFLQGPVKQYIAHATDSNGEYPSEDNNNFPLDYGTMDKDAYENEINVWNADIHLISTYAFLSETEAKKFAKEEQIYLVKEVHTHKFDNIYGSKKVKLETTGMVANWMWYFQRNDVNLRNEWSNYSNWPYKRLPNDVVNPPTSLLLHPPDLDGIQFNTGLRISGDYSVENQKNIMLNMGIILDGKYRENTLPSGIFDYIEKYARTSGYAKEGIYCYQFCLDTGPRVYQPSGAINLGKFKNIELEFQTHIPQIDSTASNFELNCLDGQVVGVNKSTWRLYEYTYNLEIFEERYNVISFISGNCATMFAR
uniref:Major capsid protein N-terminal domain-containing protein n=1 Tax=viral metagenome TaxID=1070528 RepID=A0A6C0CKR1_9ZZZZ